jgi:hypothetical protein
MKLQKTPMVLLLAAAIMGGGVYWLESRKQGVDPKVAVAPVVAVPLFAGVREADLSAMTVVREGETIALTFESLVGPPVNGKPSAPTAAQWLVAIKNSKESASVAEVAYLGNLLATGKREKEFGAGRDRLGEFGLDKPMATVEFRLKSNQRHRLMLGKATFNRSHLYALIDPADKGDLLVSLVPIEFEGAVMRKGDEWKRVKPSPSPSVSPSADSPVVSPSPRSSPSPSASPSVSTSPSPVVSPKVSPSVSPSASPSVSPSPSSSPSPSVSPGAKN